MSARQDVYLTVQQAVAKLQAMGFDVSERQVRRWAEKRALPFFLFQKALLIEENELVMHFKRMQLAAVRESNRLHGGKAA